MSRCYGNGRFNKCDIDELYFDKNLKSEDRYNMYKQMHKEVVENIREDEFEYDVDEILHEYFKEEYTKKDQMEVLVAHIQALSDKLKWATGELVKMNEN